MNATTRSNLVKAAVHSGFSVLEKKASGSPEQAEVLEGAWPNGETTKLAALSQVLATGLMVEEAGA
jgi:hypothetical protein